MIGIYKITNKLNNKIYIGQSLNISRRLYDHLYKNTDDIHGELDREIRKLGPENFETEILIECSKEDLNRYEEYYVNLYNATDPDIGYNIHDGGQQSLNYNQGRKVIDTTTFKIYDTANLCASSLEIAQSSIIRVCNHQHGSAKGHTFMWLDEYEQNGIYIYQPKDHTKIHKVKCIETNTIYENCHDAARKLNLNFRLISGVCTGKRNTTGGYHFCYIFE